MNEKKIEIIKSDRLKELNMLSASRIRLRLKKAWYLLKYGMPLKKIIRYLVLFTLRAPIERIWRFLFFKEWRGGLEKQESGGSINTCHTCRIAVNIGNAGIGDAIVALRAVRDIIGQIEEEVLTDDVADVTADIFFSSPAALKFIALPLENVRSVMDLYQYKILSENYDAVFRLNTFFISEYINKAKTKIGAEAENTLKPVRVLKTLTAIMENIKNSRKPIEKYVKLRPFSEGVLSDIIVKAGYRRENYLNYAAGIGIGVGVGVGIGVGVRGNNKPDKEGADKSGNKSVDNSSNKSGGGLRMNMNIDEEAVNKFELNGKKFITVHDGWDENTKIRKGKTSTKSYPLENWVKLVMELKAMLPEYEIVQIGGTGNGSDINGCSRNLRGKTSLREAAGILAGSSLHIDTDSGLVHIAVSLGTKCAVLFGPTNLEYCSYGQNLNIAPKKCGNCWWSKDDWMENCPRGLKTAECMESIEPAETAERIKRFLKSDTFFSGRG